MVLRIGFKPRISLPDTYKEPPGKNMFLRCFAASQWQHCTLNIVIFMRQKAVVLAVIRRNE